MYSHYCDGCGRHYESISMNDNYCSAGCAASDMDYKRQQAEYNRIGSSNNDSSSSNYNYSGGQKGIPLEVILFIAAASVAWDSMQKWDRFEPITSHILLVFNYIFYKPLHFSTNIYSYLSGLSDLHDLGGWFFLVKWFLIIFYILFVLAFYIVIIDMLNQKRLAWIWILFLLSPLITHGFWYFFIK